MKWATISPKYEYGYTCWKMFQETLRKLKPSVSFITESFAPFGTTDFRSHINTIMDANPEGLYSTEWAGELITFVNVITSYSIHYTKLYEGFILSSVFKFFCIRLCKTEKIFTSKGRIMGRKTFLIHISYNFV